MGGKTSTTSGPSKAALPHLNAASSALDSGYQQSLGLANQATGILQDNLPTVLGQTINNPALKAANGYTTDVLGGKYLDANPYFDQMLANSNANIANTVNGSIGTRGLTGGSAQTALLAQEIGKNEVGARSAQYNTERGYQQAAAGNAANLSNAGNQGIATLLAYLTGGAQLPQAVAGQYANGVNGLWGSSQTTTQKSNPGILGIAGGLLSTAADAKSLGLFSDRRLKRDVRKVGQEADGLGIYEYRYAWGGPVRRGVMADEVQALRPWAMGQAERGFSRVNYEAL